jgi:ubiquinone/menaquinone biosynthesis C-methylase UbiE
MNMNYYKRIADNYDSRWKNYTDNTLQKLIQYLPASLENKTILDFGCGTGELVKRLLSLNPDLAHITGYDPVEEILRQAQMKMSQLPEDSQKKVKLQSHLNFENKFDLIVSSSVFHYLPKPRARLHHFKSLLREGGILVLLDYTKSSLLVRYFEWFFKYIDSMHQQAYTPKQIKIMVESADFKLEDSEEFKITPLWKGFVIRVSV